jgi:hypothetical protein
MRFALPRTTGEVMTADKQLSDFIEHCRVSGYDPYIALNAVGAYPDGLPPELRQSQAYRMNTAWQSGKCMECGVKVEPGAEFQRTAMCGGCAKEKSHG